MDLPGIVTLTFLVLVSLALPLLAYLIGRAISPRIDFPTKTERFESGNLPSGRGKGYFLMQYYPYLLIFVAMEAYAVIALFIAFSYLAGRPLITLTILAISALVILPSFVYAFRKAGAIDLWREG